MDFKLVVAGIIGAVAVTAIGGVAGYRALDPTVYADVLAVEPATRTVSVPREQCRDVLVSSQRATRDPDQIAGTVAGAVVGGLLGNQIGGGSGKKVATVGGAVAGGYAGFKIQESMQSRNVEQEMQQVCETVQDTHQEPAGFDVTYRLDGIEHQVHTEYDPGARIVLEDGVAVLAN